MRILDRYIFRAVALPYLHSLIAFVAIYVVIDLFGHLDEIVKSHITGKMLFIFYGYLIPKIFVQVSPVAMLIATMLALGNLAKNNEIIAMRSSGIGLWNILRPVIIFGFFTSCIMLWCDDKIATKTYRIHMNIKKEWFEKKRSNKPKVISDVTLYGDKNRIIYARYFYPDPPILEGIIIHQQDNNLNVISKTSVQKAHWEGNRWLGTNIVRYDLNKDGQIKGGPLLLKEGILDIKERPDEFKMQRFKVEFMNFEQLKNYIQKFSGIGGSLLHKLSVEAHNRIAFPFINLVVILIGSSITLTSRRGGRLFWLAVGFSIGVLFYSILAISLAMGRAGILPPIVSAWMTNLLFTIIAFFIINRH